MIVEQTTWSADGGWAPSPPGTSAARAQLVLVFGQRLALATPGLLDRIVGAYPGAQVVGCSTAGEIAGIHVQDASVVVTAISFDRARVDVATAAIDNVSSERAGAAPTSSCPS